MLPIKEEIRIIKKIIACSIHSHKVLYNKHFRIADKHKMNTIPKNEDAIFGNQSDINETLSAQCIIVVLLKCYQM